MCRINMYSTQKYLSKVPFPSSLSATNIYHTLLLCRNAWHWHLLRPTTSWRQLLLLIIACRQNNWWHSCRWRNLIVPCGIWSAANSSSSSRASATVGVFRRKQWKTRIFFIFFYYYFSYQKAKKNINKIKI